MNTATALISAAAVAVGLGGGYTAYTIASGAGLDPAASVAVGQRSPTGSGRAAPTVRWKPCRPPAVLRGNACVTTIEETRVVAAPAPAAQPAAPVVPVVDDHGGDRPEGVSDDGPDHDEFDDHGDDDYDDDQGDDDYDDDHGDHDDDHADHDDDDDDHSGSGHGGDDDGDDDDDDHSGSGHDGDDD